MARIRRSFQPGNRFQRWLILWENESTMQRDRNGASRAGICPRSPLLEEKRGPIWEIQDKTSVSENFMHLFLFFMVILNPFAQVLYLTDLIKQLTLREFAAVHIRATLLSLGVFLLFAYTGDFLLETVFQVRLASLQIFGGIIMLVIAYRYVVIGPGSNLLFRGDINDLAPEISLPYMVGPGTIWTSIMIGRECTPYTATGMIAAVLIINTLFVIFVKTVFAQLEAQKETLLGKYFAILMRTNALLIGAISVEMIVLGLRDAFPMLAGD